MTNLDQYIATRIQHIKNQLAGSGHGAYERNGAVKRQMATLWGLLDADQRIEAVRRYFDETWPQLRAGSR